MRKATDSDALEQEESMSVNGINNVSAADLYSTYGTSNTQPAKKVTEQPVKNDTGVVYESSKPHGAEIAKMSAADRKALVAQLQSEVDTRVQQLRDIVTEMLGKQAKASTLGDGIWKMFAEGKYENVDEAAIAQAKEDISENGYWGVNQTSDRIIDFAVALAGDDPDKLNDMKSAFKKGYEKAESLWGGELPELCKNTHTAVMDKFDKLLNDSNEQ